MKAQGREDRYKLGGLKNLTKTSKHQQESGITVPPFIIYQALPGRDALKSQPEQ